ncbi:hypothetical protein NL64_06320 [Pseudomonas fluorescens]|uniref:hypothetical protein n=1 Tax=Pseudomonas fluorescens TaxID=294 RepID=UPI00054B6073|nr:hypothetical protein [Pseudomonas fluorescens]KII34873.1 hypothetical protein NL64_06320 [Pseudomonas fluorescens]
MATETTEIALDKRPMKVVLVTFDNPEKSYNYWAPADARTGDYAVVPSVSQIIQNRNMPFTIGQIVQDEVIDTSKATKAILGTFNEDFSKHVQARIEHMQRVKAKLAVKKKQYEDAAFYELLAKTDPEAAALLDELKSFNL